MATDESARFDKAVALDFDIKDKSVPTVVELPGIEPALLPGNAS